MVKFVHTETITTLDSTAKLAIAGGTISTPSGNDVGNATAADVSYIQAVPSSGILIVGSGAGQWSMISGVKDLGIGSGQSPLEIDTSGLVAWYDAAESPATLSGSGVSSWEDLSGNDYHLNNNDGPADIGDDSGVSGMLMNGTSDLFDTSSAYPGEAFGYNDQPLTVVVAFRKTDAANLGALFCFSNATSDVTTIAGYSNTDGAPRWFRRDSSSTTYNLWNAELPMDATIPTVTSWMFSGTEVSMYASGTAHTAAPSGSNTATLGSLPLNGIGGLNRFGFGKSNWFKGWIYSIAMWNRELTGDERTDIEKNFAERYGVSMGDFEDNQ